MPQDRSQKTKSAFDAALAAQRAGELETAIALYTQALQSDGNRPDALNNLGVGLRQTGRFAAAEVCYRRVLELGEPTACSYTNLGNVLRDQGKLAESEAAYLSALELDADSAAAHYGLGLVLRDLEHIEDSLDAFGSALSLDPDNAQYEWDRALSLLRVGRYREGFEAYESRWRQPGHIKLETKPEWQGDQLAGRTLLLYGEQGFGDVIQFARFLRDDAWQDGRIVIVVRPEAVPLLRSHFDAAADIRSRDEPVPDHDLVLPLLSLPRVQKLDFPDVSAKPYLHFGPASQGRLRKSSKLRVGIAWAGSPTQRNDRNRSFAVSDMAPLFSTPGVEFVSLQKGPAVKQIGRSGFGFTVHDLSPALTDFAATARILADIDLVISCDSAIVHLAGALGTPTWVALSVFHDWRYGPRGDISHWYEKTRVFKQPEPGDWASVFQRMAKDLKDFTR